MNAPSPQSEETRPEHELVRLSKQEDAGAFAALSERYLPVLQGRAARYSNIIGVDVEDFVQEGMLALYRAVKSFDEHAGIQFRTYAITCINNSMTTAIKRHMKSLHSSSGINIDDLDELALMRQMTHRSGELLVEDIFINRETSDRRAQQIAALLSDYERHVLKLYLSGLSYQRIASVLSTSTKAVDNALQRVRRKLRPEF